MKGGGRERMSVLQDWMEYSLQDSTFETEWYIVKQLNTYLHGLKSEDCMKTAILKTAMKNCLHAVVVVPAGSYR